MPILRGSVTFTRFQVEHAGDPPKNVRTWLTRALKARAFEPIDRTSEDDRSAGFVELENPEATEFSVSDLFQGERALFAYRVETLRIPARILKAELEKWMNAFESENGRPPGRQEKAEQREHLRMKLRRRIDPSVKVTDVSWNMQTEQLQIWASSKGLVEEIQQLLEDRLELRLVPRSVAGLARDAKVAVESLTPTGELFGTDVGDGEI
jgi:recombination associated protein RdgC